MSDKRTNGLGWFFSSPYLIYAVIFFLVPLVSSVYLACTNWNLISPEYDFMGLKNFMKAMKRPDVFAAFINTFKFMALFIPISLGLSMLVAVIVNSLPKFRGLYLVGFFLPYLASGVISSLIAKGILSYNSAFNVFLREKWGLDIDWLGSPCLV
ncbi:sugar ABC transporter permease [Paenactinomyces guangxiensis]|uniref:Sugar ABC transporter permease n=1 Tax=Paenactinomyces guangxiensis TaxID=1490290 RepID=A0A7W1WPG4_9BACL|nr:sugar ABC transporter permease [Paenactinomyces guangxiensis]MBA4493528.1 sugar ABC transporter permease [Paenactinomyces guangxiensis]MBH8590619.1 sugar ABC transporter permease [Paenactinomyces guangxiensis]